MRSAASAASEAASPTSDPALLRSTIRSRGPVLAAQALLHRRSGPVQALLHGVHPAAGALRGQPAGPLAHPLDRGRLGDPAPRRPELLEASFAGLGPQHVADPEADRQSRLEPHVPAPSPEALRRSRTIPGEGPSLRLRRRIGGGCAGEARTGPGRASGKVSNGPSGVAQPAERRPVKPMVVGSSPTPGARHPLKPVGGAAEAQWRHTDSPARGRVAREGSRPGPKGVPTCARPTHAARSPWSCSP